MATKHRPPLDPKLFLSEVDEGQSTVRRRKGEIVFAQGDRAPAVCSANPVDDDSHGIYPAIYRFVPPILGS